MKRRRFFQYAGLTTAGFVLATRDRVFAFSSQENSTLKPFDFETMTLDQRGRVKQAKRHTAQFFSESLIGADTLEMIAIAPGKFWMGASRGEPKSNELPRHQVSLPPFFLSKYPITQRQWRLVATLPKVKRELNPMPSHFSGEDRPVESISWLEAVEFCDRVSQYTNRRYQLPSEAQWEYACRAGTQTPFHTGETMTSQFADYVSTYTYCQETPKAYPRSTVAVGHFSPNAFGLYDLHGNVWEWCRDRWRDRSRIAFQQRRTIRGGSWLDHPNQLRSASRSGYLETQLNRTIGFRVSTV